MARVAADTLKTATAPKRNGRRPTNGNAAQAPAVVEDENGAAEPETEAEEPAAVTAAATARQLDNGVDAQAAPEETSAAATPQHEAQEHARRGRPRKTAQKANVELELSDENLIVLGKLTRMALEYGLSVDELASKLAHMVEVYEVAVQAAVIARGG